MSDVTVNLAEFNAELKVHIEQVNADVLTALKFATHSLVQKLGERTPKDTERATANWNTSVGSPDHTENPPGKYPDSPTRIARQAQAVLNGMTKPEVIWVCNPLKYISILNDGHSQQQPAGFLEMAIAEVEEELKSFTI